MTLFRDSLGALSLSQVLVINQVRLTARPEARDNLCSPTPIRPRRRYSLFGSSRALRLPRGTTVSSRSTVRPHVRPAVAHFAVAGEAGGEEKDDEEDKVDPDAEGVAKMRVSEIKAELDVRGIGYAGIFEKVRRYTYGNGCTRITSVAGAWFTRSDAVIEGISAPRAPRGSLSEKPPPEGFPRPEGFSEYPGVFRTHRVFGWIRFPRQLTT